MIDGELMPDQSLAVSLFARPDTAVNAAIAITLEHAWPAPTGSPARNVDVAAQPDNRRDTKRAGGALYGEPLIRCCVDAPPEYERHGSTLRDDGQRFVTCV
jgi:hypothetical protein